MSGLYPVSVPDKCNVEESGLLKRFVPGDLILAEKDFLFRIGCQEKLL